ncbi:MAG TPA: hypothetical protein VFK03_03575 [Candidatus Saccharimonadales bacterium]|nr:hypothetical protein [Candidatus Saccharimonadales bacterium]
MTTNLGAGAERQSSAEFDPDLEAFAQISAKLETVLDLFAHDDDMQIDDTWEFTDQLEDDLAVIEERVRSQDRFDLPYRAEAMRRLARAYVIAIGLQTGKVNREEADQALDLTYAQLGTVAAKTYSRYLATESDIERTDLKGLLNEQTAALHFARQANRFLFGLPSLYRDDALIEPALRVDTQIYDFKKRHKRRVHGIQIKSSYLSQAFWTNHQERVQVPIFFQHTLGNLAYSPAWAACGANDYAEGWGALRAMLDELAGQELPDTVETHLSRLKHDLLTDARQHYSRKRSHQLAQIATKHLEAS